jgi:biofilm PGA synthesis N-glycosyltransferase PgaC
MYNRIMNRIFIILPVKDEANFIEKTLKSIISQTLKPAKVIIVDDGSRDNTVEIVSGYTRLYPWILLKKKGEQSLRSVGPGTIKSFNFGLLNENLDECDFICKMDGDVEFKEEYFETLVSKFKQDPFLGAASGKSYIVKDGKKYAEKIHVETVAGQICFFKVDCFKDIGGFVEQANFDGIAFHRARMEGWKTWRFSDEKLSFIHLRIMGSSYKSIYNGRVRWGKSLYFIGTHPLYFLFVILYRFFEYPIFLGSVLTFWGYLSSWIKNDPQYDYPGFKRSVQAWQFERLGLGKRLESFYLNKNKKGA